MQYIDIANIACSGHAGDASSVVFFRKLAQQNQVEVSAHLSYPDRENFGRISMDLSREKLYESLSEQYKLMPDIKMIKLHGALYNDCWFNEELSQTIVAWMKKNGIQTIIAPDNSSIALLSRKADIKVLCEAFAERSYQFNSNSQTIDLMPRERANACINNIEQAKQQAIDLKNGFIHAQVDQTNIFIEEKIQAQTLCIHSDSSIALELAKSLKNV